MAASIGNGIANANADSNANIQMNKRTPYTHTHTHVIYKYTNRNTIVINSDFVCSLIPNGRTGLLSICHWHYFEIIIKSVNIRNCSSKC